MDGLPNAHLGMIDSERLYRSTNSHDLIETVGFERAIGNTPQSAPQLPAESNAVRWCGQWESNPHSLRNGILNCF